MKKSKTQNNIGSVTKILSILCLLFRTLYISAQEIKYVDIAAEVNINHTYSFFGSGGGVSFVDFDNDGLDDITLASNIDDKIHFYHNTGSGFIKINLGVNIQQSTKSILWVDYDNDGDNDLYVAAFDAANRLFKNIGDLILLDVTEEAQLPLDAKRTFGANWGDYNRDGYLDLFFGERINSSLQGSNKNRMYMNQGNGTFVEKTYDAMVADTARLPFCAGMIDLNNDNWPDIYIANDKRKRNTLFENLKDGTFRDVSVESGAGIEMDGMCVAAGDYDNDGKIDIYTTNIAEGGILLHNQSEEAILFDEKGAECMVDFANAIGWGAVWLDANNDRWLDLYISGANIGSEVPSSALFINNQLGTFNESNLGFEGDTVLSYNNALGDIDNDGQLEIMVINSGGYHSQLWRSNPSNNNWIKINLHGVKSNQDGVGSTIKVYTDSVVQMRYTTCGNSFMGQDSRNINIGLSDIEIIDSIHIIWPTGHTDKLYNINSNQLLDIDEGQTTGGIIYIDEDVSLLDPNKLQFQQSQSLAGINHTFEQFQYNGGGGAWIDIDNDLDDDLYLVGGKFKDQLYINNGDGTFTDITSTAGIGLTSEVYTTGVICGDVNNDGYKDLFITTFYGGNESFFKNLLYYNNGNNTFSEGWPMTNEVDKTMAMGSVFVDYDLDGLLDIYVISYVESAAFITNDEGQVIGYDHDCFENRLYRNKGSYLFEDVTEIQNVGDSGCALCVTATDFDNDHDMDILLGNDFGEFISGNKLFENDQETNTFNEISSATNSDVKMFAMGIAVGDYDNDLDLDYYISNIGANVLMENQNADFLDVAESSQVTNTYVYDGTTISVSWGSIFGDFDNDGDEDIFVANGYVPGPSSILNNSALDPDRIFINNGDKTFTMTDTIAGISNLFTSRGTFYSDYDLDGDLDIFTVVCDKPNFGLSPESILYENITINNNNWVGIKLQGTQVNRDAYGSKIYVYSDDKIWLRELSGGSSFCSHNSSILHVGVGTLEKIDSVKIIWTGGLHQQIEDNITINSINKIIEYIEPVNTKNINGKILNVYPNPVSNTTLIELPNNNKINDLTIYNIMGIEIRNYNWIQQNEFINLNVNIPSGLYKIKLTTNDGIHIATIVKY